MGFSLLASLGIDGKNFAAGLNSSQALAEKTGKNISDFLGSKLGAGIAAAGGFLAIKNALHEVNEEADRAKEIHIGAERMEVSIQRFQDLEAALKRIGSSAEVLEKAYDKIKVKGTEALDGNLELQASYESLGISMEDLRSKSPDQIFDKIQRNLQGAEVTAREFKAVIDTMGKGAGELVPGMRDGVFASSNAFSQDADQNKALLKWKSDMGVLKGLWHKTVADFFTPFEGELIPTMVHKAADLVRKSFGIVKKEVGKPIDIKVVTKAELEAEKAKIKDAKENEKLEEHLQALKDANAMKSMSNAEKILFLEQKRLELLRAFRTNKDGQKGALEIGIKLEELEGQIRDARGGKHGIHRVTGNLNEAQRIGAYSAISDQKLNIARDSLKELRAIKKKLEPVKPEGAWITEDSF